MLNLSQILKKEYLNYFCSLDYKEDINILTNFLDDMLSISENFDKEIVSAPPTEILNSIKDKFSIEDNILNAIIEITNKGFLKSLDTIELYTMLWYISCRNVITFDESLYKSMSKQGVIGQILNVLNSKI